MNINMPQTTTVTDLQRNFRKVVNKVKRLNQPMVVMSRNKPSFVIIDYQKFQDMQSKTSYNQEGGQKSIVNDKPDNREMFMDLFGVWDEKQLAEFKRNTSDLEKIDPRDWQ